MGVLLCPKQCEAAKKDKMSLKEKKTGAIGRKPCNITNLAGTNFLVMS